MVTTALDSVPFGHGPLMRAVLEYDATPRFRNVILLASPDWLDVDIVVRAERQRFIELMDTAEVLLHVLEPVTTTVLSGAPSLRLIQKIGVGVNTIDVDAAIARGVAVCNMPGTNSQAVAEMTLALMLATLRSVPALDWATRHGRAWPPPEDIVDNFGEINGRTVGLIGFGEVPQRLAPVLAAMGAHVVYTATAPKRDVTFPYLALDQLLATADIVSLHCPLDRATAGLLNAERLAMMKPGAILVNTARGGLVDETALADVLGSGHLRAAGVDVYGTEPPTMPHPLLALSNVVATPHVGWLTPETLARSLGVAFENCARLRDGHPLLHRVG